MVPRKINVHCFFGVDSSVQLIAKNQNKQKKPKNKAEIRIFCYFSLLMFVQGTTIMELEIIHQQQEVTQKSPLLFIHGMWHAAWCWEPHFMPYFAKNGFDTYAISLRNHGKSEHHKATWRVRISEYVEDVRQAVESIEGDPILIGHSMGGFIVQKYLEKYPASGAILLASVPPYGILGPTLKVLSKFPMTFLKANLTLNLRHIIADSASAKQLLFSESLPTEIANSYNSKMENEAYIGYLDMMLFDLPKAKKIPATKMLVIGGEDDQVISTKDLQKTAKIYQADLKILPNIAHDMMLDTHWEAAAHEILSWLSNGVGQVS